MLHCTVIMPAYNSAVFIDTAIQSTLAQRYKDWDLVVVDDGSQDDTFWIAERYRRKYSKHILVVGSAHQGCCSATKLALSYARGPVITVLDADDKLFPQSLTTVLPYFERDLGLGYVWTQFVRSNGGRGWSGPLPNGRNLYESIVRGKWWRACAQRFFRKSVYQQTTGLNEHWQRAVDLQLAILVASTGCRTCFVPAVTYWYRVHPRQMSCAERVAQAHDSKAVVRWAQRTLG